MQGAMVTGIYLRAVYEISTGPNPPLRTGECSHFAAKVWEQCFGSKLNQPDATPEPWVGIRLSSSRGERQESSPLFHVPDASRSLLA